MTSLSTTAPFYFVIPAQAGIQFFTHHEAAVRLHAGEWMEWNVVRWRDVQPHQAGLGAQERRGRRLTKTYGVHDLVWFEQHVTMESGILREKAIKEWKRSWKVKAIEAANPLWRDLYPDILR